MSSGPPATIHPNPTKPSALNVLAPNIPSYLQAQRQWVVWRYEEREGKWTKPPYQPNGELASTGNPETWCSLDAAWRAYKKSDGYWSGIGYVLSKLDPFAGIDLDHAIDAATGELKPWAAEIVERIDSYAEMSPSGTGIRIFATAILPAGAPAGGRKKKGLGEDGAGVIEMYDGLRYLTVTGHRLATTPRVIQNREEAFAELYHELFPPRAKPETVPPPPAQPGSHLDDYQLLAKMFSSRNGAGILALYNGDTSRYHGDDSAADCALLAHLAWWCNRDEARMDRLFRQSRLYREKWEREDYRAATIGKALEGVTEGFEPSRHFPVGEKDHTAPAEPPEDPEPDHAPPPTDAPRDPEDRGLHLTDTGNAERLIRRHGRDVRYWTDARKWLIWDGRRWRPDGDGAIVRRAIETARSIYAEAAAIADPDTRDAVVAWAKRSESKERLTAMVELARSLHAVSVSTEALDRDPWALNCQNGTVDLRTGLLRSHTREDLITKICPANYDATTPTPVFTRFLEQVIPDEAVRAFVQRAAGYSATGHTGEEALFLPFGSGRNGKSKLLGAIEYALGDYARATRPETFTVKTGDAIPNDVAALVGARFVPTAEAEEGKRLDVQLVKQLTGGDTMSARFMRGEFFTFKFTGKVWFAVNHKPIIRDTTESIWERVKLIPFTVYIPPEERDKHLDQKLRLEAPGILRWIVEGCLLWQKLGLAEPPAVRDAVQDYRSEMDTLSNFIQEYCLTGSQYRVWATPLYEAYKQWCEAAGERQLTQRSFGMKLTERGFQRLRSTAGKSQWLGITLRATDGTDDLLSASVTQWATENEQVTELHARVTDSDPGSPTSGLDSLHGEITGKLGSLSVTRVTDPCCSLVNAARPIGATLPEGSDNFTRPWQVGA